MCRLLLGGWRDGHRVGARGARGAKGASEGATCEVQWLGARCTGRLRASHPRTFGRTFAPPHKSHRRTSEIPLHSLLLLDQHVPPSEMNGENVIELAGVGGCLGLTVHRQAVRRVA